MIKANELRIGNWVKVENDFERVDNILEDGAYCYLSKEAESVFQPYSFINPIPLTEEWLLKMGFDEIDIEENKNNVRVFHLNGIYCNTLYGVYYYTHLLKQIQYVHQLQNLYFALTGEELEVKL